MLLLYVQPTRIFQNLFARSINYDFRYVLAFFGTVYLHKYLSVNVLIGLNHVSNCSIESSRASANELPSKARHESCSKMGDRAVRYWNWAKPKRPPDDGDYQSDRSEGVL